MKRQTYNFKPYKIIQTPCLWETYQNYNYIIAREDRAIIFDPGEFQPVDQTLEEHQLQPQAIILTHHHKDHVGAVIELKQKYNCPVYGHSLDQHRLPGLTHTYNNKETLHFLDLQLQAFHAPGHTTGLCFFWCKEKEWIFVNDLLFSMGCGRLFEGSPEQMWQSLEHLKSYPKESLIFSSHEYTRHNTDFSLKLFPHDKNINAYSKLVDAKLAAGNPTLPVTLEQEINANPFLRCHQDEIAEALNLKGQSPLAVFTQIRHLRDRF